MTNAQQMSILSIPSHPKNVEEVTVFIEKMAEQLKIAPDVYGNILISLTEAVNNAIIHGNCSDETKVVKVAVRKERNNLTLKVSDEGCGFDPASLPDPTAPENLLRIGGRGVFLMQQLCDQVRFENNGSCVEMRFRI